MAVNIIDLVQSFTVHNQVNFLFIFGSIATPLCTLKLASFSWRTADSESGFIVFQGGISDLAFVGPHR